MRHHHNRGGVHSSAKKIIFVIFCIALLVVLGILLYIYKQDETERKQYYEALSRQIVEEQRAEKAEAARVAEIRARIPGVVCWGDSLTAGAGGEGITYPKVLSELLSANNYITTTVINMGVGGENTREIMARAGALNIVLTEDMTIPADPIAVQVFFAASDGSKIAILRQGDGGATNVSISGIEGRLSIQQESCTAKEYTYWFTRKTAGGTVVVPSGTQIINDGSYLYTDYIPVVFIGQNGGWDNPASLTEQQQAILDTCGKNKDHFIIIGLTTGEASSREELEATMQSHWGAHYVNLREALCNEELLVNYGVELNAADVKLIDKGVVPEAIRSDGVHFNATGYTIIGNIIYQRIIELGYIER